MEKEKHNEVKAEKVTESQNQSSSQTSDSSDIEKNKTMAILSYFIFFIPLLTDAKDSRFAKFHANQSLILLIFSIVANFISGLLMIVLIGFLLLPIVNTLVFVLWILGIINANNGEMKRLPLIGGIDIIK